MSLYHREMNKNILRDLCNLIFDRDEEKVKREFPKLYETIINVDYFKRVNIMNEVSAYTEYLYYSHFNDDKVIKKKLSNFQKYIKKNYPELLI